VIVSLTPLGRDAVDAALHDLVTRERGLLAGLDSEEQHRLAALLRRILVPLDGG
jgi:DNA-binding MarR family transcriptional regulator